MNHPESGADRPRGDDLPAGLFRDSDEAWQRPHRAQSFEGDLTDDTLFRRSRRRAAPDDGYPEAMITHSRPAEYSPKRGGADDDPTRVVPVASRAATPAHSSTSTHSPAPAETSTGTHSAATDQGSRSLSAATHRRRPQPQHALTSDAETRSFDRHHPFTRSLVKTVASTVVPGLGLIRSRARWLGVVLTAGFALALIAIAGWVMLDPVNAAAIALKPAVLRPVSFALIVVALIWVAVIVLTHVLTRPQLRNRAQRVVGALAVGGLSFAVAAPLAVAARYTSTQAGLVETVFSSDKKKSQTRPTIDTKQKPADVWADKQRLNILLVGLDNTSLRNYSDTDVSTDTMMVASIDTATGNTVIVQVPRNMAKVPFPAGSELAKRYPYGWYDGSNADNDSYFANSIWGHLPTEQPDLFANTDYKNADALKLGMEGALGLKIDYFMALNVDGLVAFIDALGGVKLNVNYDIPITDRNGNVVGEVKSGQNRQLNGYYAMWYARARKGAGDDYGRMSRQSCVIKAVIDQSDPATVLTRYEAIAKASGQLISTDIPQSMLPALLELGRRVKNGKQTRVLFTHQKDGFVTYNPDYEMMRARVNGAITAANQATTTPEPNPSASSPAATPSVSTSSSKPTRTRENPSSTRPSESTPVPAENLSDACAWNPTDSPTPGR